MIRSDRSSNFCHYLYFLNHVIRVHSQCLEILYSCFEKTAKQIWYVQLSVNKWIHGQSKILKPVNLEVQTTNRNICEFPQSVWVISAHHVNCHKSTLLYIKLKRLTNGIHMTFLNQFTKRTKFFISLTTCHLLEYYTFSCWDTYIFWQTLTVTNFKLCKDKEIRHNFIVLFFDLDLHHVKTSCITVLLNTFSDNRWTVVNHTF